MSKIPIKLKGCSTLYCKKCKFPYTWELRQGKKCILFDQDLIPYSKKLPDVLYRCQKCIDSETNQKTHLIGFEITCKDEECGDCLYQWTGCTDGNYHECGIFDQQIIFEPGVVPEGDDIYEIHYRCKKCLNREIKKL